MSDAPASDATVQSAEARARKRQRRARWGARIAAAGMRVLARTWRVRELHQGTGDIVRQHEHPAIFCLWHCELLCHMWNFRELGIVVLISEHGDGEIAARAAESLGYRTIRGSSRRGAERALLSLAREAEGGAHVAVTPDGPRGPAESFAPGALIAAQRSGAPIVLLRAVVDRAWRLRSWDRFIIPKPFARLTIYVSEPLAVHAASLRAAAGEAPRFQALMRALPNAIDG
ncbi:MAG: lysophospholipid acyltransferase family protein [Gemmatimonadota bacterium]